MSTSQITTPGTHSASTLSNMTFDDLNVARVATLTGVGFEVCIYLAANPREYLVAEPLPLGLFTVTTFAGADSADNYAAALAFAANLAVQSVREEENA